MLGNSCLILCRAGTVWGNKSQYLYLHEDSCRETVDPASWKVITGFLSAWGQELVDSLPLSDWYSGLTSFFGTDQIQSLTDLASAMDQSSMSLMLPGPYWVDTIVTCHKWVSSAALLLPATFYCWAANNLLLLLPITFFYCWAANNLWLLLDVSESGNRGREKRRSLLQM